MNDCQHNKIKVIRQGRGYVWSCALCGEEIVRWDRFVWDAVMQGVVENAELVEGEGFLFDIVEGGSDAGHRPDRVLRLVA